MVRLLIAAHADVNARSLINTNRRQVTGEPRAQARPPGGMTPLLYAARQGCLGCVKYLAEGKADLNMADPEGITPMLIATENFNFDIAAYLVKQGADVNRWDWWGRTPLYAAVDLNTLPYGGRPDHISMDDTTSLKLIELLLTAGANPNAQLKLFPPYRSLGADRGGDTLLTVGTTPLLRAAKAGDAPAIKLLLAHHASPDISNNADVTPLMAAAGVGTSGVDTRGKYKTQAEASEAIKLLVAGGANVNATDVRGLTALHGAALLGFDDVVRTLAAENAHLDAKDKRGVTPLDMALGKGGGLGRGGEGATVHQSTADLIKQLLANNAQGGAAPPAPPPTAANTPVNK
jgi:ankyrin repeat protein